MVDGALADDGEEAGPRCALSARAATGSGRCRATARGAAKVQGADEGAEASTRSPAEGSAGCRVVRAGRRSRDGKPGSGR